VRGRRARLGMLGCVSFPPCVGLAASSAARGAWLLFVIGGLLAVAALGLASSIESEGGRQ
jgi:hypothetical protein